jgi:hypothetical protein
MGASLMLQLALALNQRRLVRSLLSTYEAGLLQPSSLSMSSLCSLLLVCLLVSLPVVLSSGFPAGPRSSAAADYAPFDPTYELVWSDEFNQADGSPPDPSVWTHETGGSGEGNHELEFYTDRINNSFIQDGRLVIQGLKEQYQKHNYTSARIDSAGKVEVLYGLLAARARIRMYDGFWPAFVCSTRAHHCALNHRCTQRPLLAQFSSLSPCLSVSG